MFQAPRTTIARTAADPEHPVVHAGEPRLPRPRLGGLTAGLALGGVGKGDGCGGGRRRLCAFGGRGSGRGLAARREIGRRRIEDPRAQPLRRLDQLDVLEERRHDRPELGESRRGPPRSREVLAHGVRLGGLERAEDEQRGQVSACSWLQGRSLGGQSTTLLDPVVAGDRAAHALQAQPHAGP